MLKLPDQIAFARGGVAVEGWYGSRSEAAAGVLVLSTRPKTWRPCIAAEASRPFASAGLAQLLFDRFQPLPESAIYGADFSWRDSSRGDVGQYSALKHSDLV